MTSFLICLIQKIQLTHDVYELVYSMREAVDILPGQFLLCDTDKTNPRLRRAYSVSFFDGENIHFIIKRMTNGKGGSMAICDQEIGHIMRVWGPTGSFVLPTQKISKHIIFIGTGTGFAPLYYQAKTLLEHNPLQKISFTFGVREEKDLFYQDILQKWNQIYPNFVSQLCLSQSETEVSSGYFHGRVTDYIQTNPTTCILLEAIYAICGSPSMVSEMREILQQAGIDDKNVFFEQY